MYILCIVVYYEVPVGIKAVNAQLHLIFGWCECIIGLHSDVSGKSSGIGYLSEDSNFSAKYQMHIHV